MQGGDEHGALDRELECALLQQADQDVGDAEPLPDFAKQQRAADPLGGDRQRALGVLVERIDQQHLIGELGARGNERSERAGGGQLVGAAEIGDHPLAHGRAVARVLDDLHIAALAGPLEAEEHGPSLSSTTEFDSPPDIKRKNCANVALHFAKTAHRPNDINALRARGPVYCSSRAKRRTGLLSAMRRKVLQLWPPPLGVHGRSHGAQKGGPCRRSI